MIYEVLDSRHLFGEPVVSAIGKLYCNSKNLENCENTSFANFSKSCSSNFREWLQIGRYLYDVRNIVKDFRSMAIFW